ncbi:hypothetical protein BKA56DRAFT_668005 [Ilyonectria sp. MPI-CAGE-AT-0026]|nr:hypothetical protein BKA56DRAFT_668005 [Ilyonectria sp. MPI-CAGE-AT-0026]
MWSEIEAAQQLTTNWPTIDPAPDITSMWPSPAPQSDDLATVPNADHERPNGVGFAGFSSLGGAHHIGHQSQYRAQATTGNRQLGQSTSWSDIFARGTDMTMDETPQELLPNENEGIPHPGYIDISEQDLSLFLEANFHFPEDS